MEETHCKENLGWARDACQTPPVLSSCGLYTVAYGLDNCSLRKNVKNPTQMMSWKAKAVQNQA